MRSKELKLAAVGKFDKNLFISSSLKIREQKFSIYCSTYNNKIKCSGKNSITTIRTAPIGKLTQLTNRRRYVTLTH